MNKIKVTKINVDLFKDFLTKLVSFDKNIFIKIDSDMVKSHLYLENKDAVKIVSVNTSDVFEFSKPLENEIKIVLQNAKDIITALNFFTTDNVKGEIMYSDSPDGSLSATSFLLENDEEKFRLFCLDPNFGFIDMTDDEVNAVFETDALNTDPDSDQTYFVNFELTHDMLKKIDSRLRINKNESKFTFQIVGNKVLIVTKNYELTVSDKADVVSKEVENVTLFQKYLSLLDKENYRVFLCSNKIIFESQVSDTKLAIASSSEEADLDDMEDLNDDLSGLDDLEMDI